MTLDDLRSLLAGAPVVMRPALATNPAGLGVALPATHQLLLTQTDGLSAYGGYLRLFGASELIAWNDSSTWKFAWPSRIREYFCFAETAWGDQYAYRYDELVAGPEPAVYFLESITLEPERLTET